MKFKNAIVLIATLSFIAATWRAALSIVDPWWSNLALLVITSFTLSVAVSIASGRRSSRGGV